MNASELLDRMQSDTEAGKELDFRAVRDEIHAASELTTDPHERVVLLKLFHLVLDAAERSGNVAPENLDTFRQIRAKDYRLLLMREVLIGENVSTKLLNAVTQREVQAGRMSEQDELRLFAVKALAEPYLSVQDLLRIEQQRLATVVKPRGWRRWFSKS